MNEVSELRRSAAISQLQSDGWLVHVDWLHEIDSTNSLLKRMLVDQASSSLPRLVVADRQTSGRGRGKNAWWSPDGCLMFSIAWRPDRSAQSELSEFQSRMSQLPLVVGVSIASALQSILVNRDTIKVKWPNDVYVDRRKLAGVLIESIVGAADPVWIIGAGINVLVDMDSAPETIRSRATSLHRECTSAASISLSMESILIAIVQRLCETLALWQANSDFLSRLWQDYCLLTGRWVEIQTSDKRIQGTCCGIDDRGALIIQDPRGVHHTILSGVVESWT